jgi:hypothetical protein
LEAATGGRKLLFITRSSGGFELGMFEFQMLLELRREPEFERTHGALENVHASNPATFLVGTL